MNKTRFQITNIRFSSASPGDVSKGLLGFACFTLDRRLRVDCVGVRLTLDGRLTLAFPRRKDGNGHDHFVLRPVNDVSRRELECAVLSALGFVEVARR